MSRAGRKRKDVRRQPNGQPHRPPMRDQGTEELQSRRKYLAGKGDMILTTFPLGILRANNAISEEEYRAGCRFAWLHASVIGRSSLAAVDFERTHGKALHDVDDAREERLQELWRESIKLFSRHDRDELISLCVYERTPRFMRPIPPIFRDIIQADTITSGLRTLARCYGYLDARRAVA